MQPAGDTNRVAHFGVFQVDLRTGELTKHGIRLKLQTQPFRLLELLLEHSGELVTREQVRNRLWPADTYVDFDNSLNAAVSKLREALNDNPASPRFVETVPRRGFRFVAPVQFNSGSAAAPPTAPEPSLSSAAPVHEPPFAEHRREPVTAPAAGAPQIARNHWYWIAGLVMVLAVGALAPRLIARFASRPVAHARLMLAVLPFESLSSGHETEYFVTGLSEEMITKLGSLQPARLGVISRASVIQYKQARKSIQEIGHELNVQYVLEGSVREMGSRVRISMQLSQVADQTQLWSQSYERNLADVFAIQSDVARQVANALALRLLPNEQAALERAATDNMSAYEEYLRGRYYWNQRTQEGLARCLTHFQNAVNADPNYALAQAGLADCYNLNGGYALLPPGDAFPRAKRAAQTAIELDDSLAQGHTALGFALLYYDWNWAEAELEFKRAIELNANYVLARVSYAQLLRALNRLDEADTQLRLAHDVDPMDRVGENYRGWIEFTRRRYARATEIFRGTVASYPSWSSAYISLGYGLAQERKFDESLAALQKARLYSADAPSALEAYGYVAALAGKKEEARAILQQLQAVGRTRRVSSYDIAMIYAATNEQEQAFRWLDRAITERDPWMIWLGVHPEWDALRSDPRFSRLLTRLNL